MNPQEKEKRDNTICLDYIYKPPLVGINMKIITC